MSIQAELDTTIESPLLTQEEAARYLRTTVEVLANMRHRGNTGPKFVRIGRQPLYREQALLDWITETEVRSCHEDRENRMAPRGDEATVGEAADSPESLE